MEENITWLVKVFPLPYVLIFRLSVMPVFNNEIILIFSFHKQLNLGTWFICSAIQLYEKVVSEIWNTQLEHNKKNPKPL
jgi:hypothetical protein